MSRTSAFTLPARVMRRANGAPLLRLVLLAAVVLGPLSTAGQVLAQQQQQVAAFPRSAAFMPSQTGFYMAINLAPDAAQRGVLDRLFSYYMQDADIASSWQQAMSEVVTAGITTTELREGITSWVGGEAFIAIPSPGAIARMAELQGWAMAYPTDVPFLGGIAVRDPGALIAFLSNLGSRAEARDGAGEMTTSVHNGMTIMTLPGSSGPPIHVAMPTGFMLFATNLQILTEALDRTPTTSLASSAGFQEVVRGSAQAPLAVFYSDTPGIAAPRMPGFPDVPTDITAWSGATLRVDAQGLRVDQVSATNLARLTPALRAVAEIPANPYQSSRVAPRDSAVFFAASHLHLIWAAIKEVFASSQEMSDMLGEASLTFRAGTGLDLERDIFSWMTGEIAGFLSPAGVEATAGIGGALIVQASDAETARTRLATIVDAISRSASGEAVVTPVALGGASFSRISSPVDEFALYLGAVGPWAVAAHDAAVAAGIAQRVANAAEQGLSGDAAFTALRGPAPSQSLLYVDITGLTELTIRAANAPAREAGQARFYTAPFKRAIITSASTAERSRSTFVLQIVVP